MCVCVNHTNREEQQCYSDKATVALQVRTLHSLKTQQKAVTAGEEGGAVGLVRTSSRTKRRMQS